MNTLLGWGRFFQRHLIGWLLAVFGLFLWNSCASPSPSPGGNLHLGRSIHRARVYQSPMIRVGIAYARRFEVFAPDSFYIFSRSGLMYRGTSGNYTVRFLKGISPERIPYVWVGTTPSLDSATALKIQWELLGYPLRVEHWGHAFRFRTTELDAREYAIFVGPLESPQVAKQDSLLREFPLFWIPKGEATGWLEVTDALGNVVVRCASPVRFLPTPHGNHTFRLLNVRPGIRFIATTPQNLHLLGILEFRVASDSNLVVINELPLEEYLKGVVPVEMPSNYPLEALKAQAIVARTYALWTWDKGRNFWEPFDLPGDYSAQAYGDLKTHTYITDLAVWNTRGKIVVYRGRPIEALFHSCCGGHTESAQLVFGHDRPYLRGVFCGPEERYATEPLRLSVRDWIAHPPDECYGKPENAQTPEARRNFRWTVRLDPKEVRRRILRYTGVDVGKITAIRPLQRGVSGRILRLEIVGTRNRVVLEGQYRIRQVLRNPPLKSSLFTVELIRSLGGLPVTIVLRGGGAGHGVGMCQVGAAGMAREGFTAAQIVAHYYPGTRILHLYP